MSRREKKTILYSRNGIKIEKTQFLDMNLITNIRNKNTVSRTTFSYVVDSSKNKIIKGKPAYTEKIQKESKLGFYYYKIIHHSATEDKVIRDAASFHKFIIRYSDVKFEISYPYHYNGMEIGSDNRPWDLLPGYKGIPDHFITDLQKQIEKVFDECEGQPIEYTYKQYSPYIDGYVGEKVYGKNEWIPFLRKILFKDLFGSEEGPIITLNDIKIESHGFDKKVSFRKRKENEQ